MQLRNRALIAFSLLSGARDQAIVSFKLKHVDIETQLIEQDAREVRTKRAKTFTSWFFPSATTSAEFLSIGSASCASKKASVRRTHSSEIQSRAGRQSRVLCYRPRSGALGERRSGSGDLPRSLRACGLALFQSASVRNTLVQLAYELKLDAEQFKAWSQNLGHENCLTTFSSYGEIQPSRQAEIIRGLARGGDAVGLGFAVRWLQLSRLPR